MNNVTLKTHEMLETNLVVMQIFGTSILDSVNGAALPRSMKTIQDHIVKLDREYDTLNEEMATGENAKFGPESMSQTHTKTSIPYHTRLMLIRFHPEFYIVPFQVNFF